MIRMILWLLLPIMLHAADYSHNLQFNVTLAKSYFNYDTGMTSIPITGTKNMRIELVDTTLDQPFWFVQRDMPINNGQLTVMIDDDSLDWVALLTEKDLVLRVTITGQETNSPGSAETVDFVDIPFEFLPFAMVTEFSQRARYFNDDSVIAIDYPNERVAIQSPIGDDMLLVSGNIHADFLVGDASKITNLTGPGLNDSHSLNSEGGQFKDVVFASNSGRLGIHTNTPNARLHIKGSVVFRGGLDDKKDDYIVPDGPLLLWDPARAAFRSGIFNQRFSSTDIAPYSIGFGEDVIIKSRYSSILGGQNHAIRPYSEASVIVGGQSHTIADKHAVIVGGFDHLLTGEWSVVFGGREHQVTGDYNVILGGKINRVDGKFNTVIGNQNTVISDLSVVLGNQNVVLGDQSLAFGSDIRLSQDHPMSLMYSDASEPLKSGQPQQMVVQSRHGLGINMAPVPGHALSVSGNIKATRFIGDGQHLTNIISGQDHWRQQIDTPTGIYYMGGPVSVGTTDSMASLTVAGGIAVGEANQASNGTLRFNDLGLQFYHDGWVPVDSEDTNTTLKPGPSLLLDNGVFSIDQMDAMPWNALFFNGETWSPKKNQVWDFYQRGVHIDIKFLMAKNIESNANGAMVIESHIDDASTSHPLVVGVTDSLRFSPGQNRLLFNVDASGSDIHIVDSDNKDSTKQFGGMLTVDEGGMTLQQTLKPYALNEPVSLRTLMQLTPTAMAFHQFPPVVTFDTRGSVSFKKTVLDHGGAGIGHLSRWAQSKYTNQMPDHPHYLFFNDGQLNLMAGLDDSSQPILLKVGTQAKAKFNADGELVVGDGTARGKLSVFGGGLSFNAQGTNVGIDEYSGQRTAIQSQSVDNPSIQLNYHDSRNDLDMTMADFGSLNTAIGTQNRNDISVLIHSDDVPQIDIRSTERSAFIVQNNSSDMVFENNNGIFSLLDAVNDEEPKTLIRLDNDNHLSMLTPIYSERPTTEVVLNADIELSNSDTIRWLTNERAPVLHAYKDSNHLIFKHMSTAPIRFQTELGTDSLVVSANRQLAIHSTTPTSDSTLYVAGDVRFNNPIYYQHNSDDRLVQSFVVDTSTQLTTDTFEPVETRGFMTEDRSIKTMRIDEISGLRLTVKDDDTILISAPGYYKRQYESRLWDGDPAEQITTSEYADGLSIQQDYIESEVKHDIFELRELYPNGGVSISAIDTDNDTVPDAIEFYMPLIDGGTIKGDITVNGTLTVKATNADGRKAYNIPYEWQRLVNNLIYYKNNVGIGTEYPQFDLDVSGNMASKELTVSDELIMQTLRIENATSTQVDGQMLWSVDANNDALSETIEFNSISRRLLSIITNGEDERIGVFTKAPMADIHLKQAGREASVLLESKASGTSGLRFYNSDDPIGAYVQVNRSSGANHAGTLKETVMVSSRNIYVQVNGNTNPSMFIKDTYVSIGVDDRPNNELTAKSSVTIGDEFAGQVTNGSQRGLTIQNSLSVGAISPPLAQPTGATFYSKDNLAIGDSVIVTPNFKGVRVQGRVGAGIKNPEDGLSLAGTFKLTKSLAFYHDDRTQKMMEFLPESFTVFPDNQPLDVQMSSSVVFVVGGDTNYRALSVHHNSVTIGSAEPIDSSNLFITHADEASMRVEATEGMPKIVFSVDGHSRHGAIGIQPVGGSTDTEIAIESNGDTLDSPDIQIHTQKVGFGKVPGHALDVDGTVKVDKLYMAGNRMYPVPMGAIAMWAGQKDDIPSGWQLCDGTNGTPDLRNKFIKGASLSTMNQEGGANNPTITGGAHEHEGGGHEHVISGGGHAHSVGHSSASLGAVSPHTISLGEQTYGKYPAVLFSLALSFYKYVNIATSKSHHHSLGNTNHGHGVNAHTQGAVHHKQDYTQMGGHTHTGGSHAHTWQNEPAYFVLAYIIKVEDM